MKQLLKIFLICECALFCGCLKISSGEIFRHSFIEKYCVIKTTSNAETELYFGDNNDVRVKLPNRVYVMPHNTGHKELSDLYGDVGFGRMVPHPEGIFTSSWAFPFNTFEVVSDSDFDEHHPAGTPLNDLITITYYTYKLYIENGYKHTDGRGGYSGDWITKPLSELVPEDAIFMDPFELMKLRFNTTSTTAGVHHLTLTVSMENSKYYEVEFDMDFGGSE